MKRDFNYGYNNSIMALPKSENKMGTFEIKNYVQDWFGRYEIKQYVDKEFVMKIIETFEK